MKILKSVVLTFLFATPSVFFAQTTEKGVPTTTTTAPTATATAVVQQSLVSETDRLMSQGNKTSLLVNLPKANAKFAEKIWKDFSKQFKGEYKKDKKNEEYFTDNAMIVGIGGANTVDMYVKFAESGENTTATLWIDLGGAFVNSKDFKDKYSEAEKLLLNYAVTVSREQTKIQLDDQQKELKSFEKKQRNLESDKDGLLKDIDGWKKKIAKAESDVINNTKAQEDSKVKIETQKKLVDEIQKKLNSLN